MSNLKKNQIVAINSSFYTNVFLLTQIISPSFEFQQHFKKDMFNKPNTTGFVYISHYLSSIYDTKLFKQMVSWPLLCKKDEVTYRIEMKNFLCLLSRDNFDLNFPSILMSHLIQSGGVKFQIIMWKLSQLALRTYIKRELQGELLNAPCMSPVQDLTITYFNNIITQKCSIVRETHKKMKKILKTANNFLNGEIEILNAYKSEIFDRKENVKKLVLDLPAHPLVQKRLMDIEDSNITDLWKRNIFKKVQYIRRKNKELNELGESCSHLCKLILRINSNSGTIEANKFPEICCDNYLLYMQFDMQHLIRNLHINGPVFSTLLSLLHLILAQMLHHENIANLSDLSQCLLFIQNACKKIKSLQMLFNALNTRIDRIYKNEQCMSQKRKNACINLDASNVSIINLNILLQSPKINFDFNQYMDNNLFYKRLYSSPMEGKHKYLFKRYKRKHRPLCELPATLLDFSKSWNSMSGWLSPRAYSIKSEQISHKGKPSPLYTRLLHHTKLDLKHSKENISRSPKLKGLYYEGLNLTPKKCPLKTEHLAMNNRGSKLKNLSSILVTYISPNTKNRNVQLD